MHKVIAVASHQPATCHPELSYSVMRVPRPLQYPVDSLASRQVHARGGTPQGLTTHLNNLEDQAETRKVQQIRDTAGLPRLRVSEGGALDSAASTNAGVESKTKGLAGRLRTRESCQELDRVADEPSWPE